jgi:cyclase
VLKKRLIAVLILRDGQIVQSVNFKHTNVIGNAITAVDFFNKWAVDEIVLLDVSRTTGKRDRFYPIVEDLSRKCFVPLTVGGWVRDVDEMRRLLRAGADKIVINTEAVRRPELISEGAALLGNQCMVVSIDARRIVSGGAAAGEPTISVSGGAAAGEPTISVSGGAAAGEPTISVSGGAAAGEPTIQSQHEVFVDRGREATGLSPFDWARTAEARGAGELFVTSIDHDGVRRGYDLELLRGVADAVDIPVIAFGGVFTWQHLVDGVVEGHAEAVSAANIFHYTEHSTKKAKEFMRAAGIDVR